MTVSEHAQSRQGSPADFDTVGNKADTLHKYTSYTDKKALKRAYELQVREAIKKLKIRDVELAIDGKKDFYYGKNGSVKISRGPPVKDWWHVRFAHQC